MSLIVHETVIKDKMTQLANVTQQAQDRINTQILSNAGRSMLESLGEIGYSEYVTTLDAYEQDDYDAFDRKAFGELSNNEKELRNLIYAEAYFGLYYLALALKKLVKGAVNTKRDTAGGATIYASAFDDIMANADNYLEQAYTCLGFADNSTNNEDPIYIEGQAGVFVV